MNGLRVLRNFRLSHMGDYLKRFPYYVRSLSYYRYIDMLRRQGIEYGIVKGTNEQYIFDIDDKCIPIQMYRSRRTYSENDIRHFFYLVKKFCKEKAMENGGYFLDIGANIGTTSVYVAKNIDPSMRILAFEPDAVNFKMLETNCLINGCANIRPVNIALSDQSASKQMVINETNRANSKVLTDKSGDENEPGKNDKTENIEAYRLDDWLKEQNIGGSDIGYIWMDIEGHETYAIKGMMELLTNYKPPIFMEFTAKDNEYVTVSEEEFNVQYAELSSVYNRVIIPGLDKEKEFSIGYLKELYYGTKEQYNIFLF